ncbi:MAG: leucine-rich repeat domain-containing protein [Treponema sp.]|nr:leucine-rich repeat domain-containing protein [Treponema sp.]
MKNVVRVLGMVVLAALVGFTMAACDTGGGGGGAASGGVLTVSATDGRLTITGLEAHDGRRVIAFGAHDQEVIAAAESISVHAVYTGGIIADGTVELNVWAFVGDYNNPGYTNFDGTGTAYFFEILVINRASIGDGERDAIGEYFYEGGQMPDWLMDYSLASVEFDSGIGSMLWYGNGGNGDNGIVQNQTPIASHYTFGNLNQIAGSVTAVTIAPNPGASPGAILNIRYNGETTIPQIVGTFDVTFDVEAAAGWYAATGLFAGNLVVVDNGGNGEPDDPAYTAGLTFTPVAGGYAVTGFTGTDTDIVIPAAHNGQAVVSIGNNAFSSRQLTSVIIPDSVTSIGNNAFWNNQLTSVTLGSSVTNISGNAFANNQLTSVVIPNSVTAISGFQNNQLTSVIIPNSVTSIGGSAFSGNQLTSVVIPDNVTSIGNWAFEGNQLTSVTLGSSVTTIGNSAFAGNAQGTTNRLTSVTIPDSVTSIGDSAFQNNALTSVTIGNSVTSIASNAFANNQLTNVTIGNSVTSIGLQAFWGNQLTSVVIPPSVTSIGNNAFLGNELTSITIGGGVNIANNASMGTHGQSFLTLYNGNQRMAGTYTWSATPLPGSWTRTDIAVFTFAPVAGGYAVTSLVNMVTGIAIPAVHNGLPVVSIGVGAFQFRGLTSVIIPNSITAIGSDAFWNNQLTSVTIPASVTTIGSGAFESNQLTSVTIPNSVTTIGNNAFQNNQLTTVTIGNSVTSIGNSAFAGNAQGTTNRLTSVTIPNSVTTIGNNAFQNNQLTTVTIGSSVTSIGASAFASNSLTSVTIPNSVANIGNNAFQGSVLTAITIGGGVEIGNAASMGNHGALFLTTYNGNGRLAGIYTWSAGLPIIGSPSWTRQ